MARLGLLSVSHVGEMLRFKRKRKGICAVAIVVSCGQSFRLLLLEVALGRRVVGGDDETS